MDEQNVDYVGFGCHYKNCIDKGYPYRLGDDIKEEYKIYERMFRCL